VDRRRPIPVYYQSPPLSRLEQIILYFFLLLPVLFFGVLMLAVVAKSNGLYK
jgi:hypothetical protein